MCAHRGCVLVFVLLCLLVAWGWVGDGIIIMGVYIYIYITYVYTGAKIVHCCGFDSVPSDLGCLMMVNHMKENGVTPTEVIIKQ